MIESHLSCFEAIGTVPLRCDCCLAATAFPICNGSRSQRVRRPAAVLLRRRGSACAAAGCAHRQLGLGATMAVTGVIMWLKGQARDVRSRRQRAARAAR